MGEIAAMQQVGGDVRLSIRSMGLPFSSYEVGESIAVNGVCLTAVDLREDGFDTDVSNETLAVTGLGQLAIGSAVNLEPSLRLADRLGGHLVSGHVDCIGTVESHHSDARSVRLKIRIPDDYLRFVAKKGSICVDGVSLTVNEVSDACFEVNIIPHTADVTIIGDYSTGTRVNIEVDVVARYLERLIRMDDDAGITRDFLKAHGYA